MRHDLERRLKLSHLRAIESLVRHGSLLRASGPLGVTQPALTRTIHEVEAVVGYALFERLPRGMRPTEAGRLLAAAAGRILADLRRLEEDLDHLVGGAPGTVAIGALPVAAAGVLPGALQRLREKAPGIKVRLEQGRSEELLPLLASGALDLVVGRLYPPPIPDGLRREALWEEPIVVLARSGHPLLDGRAVSREDLRRYQLLLPTVGQRVGQEIEHVINLLCLPAAAVLRSSSATFIREMVLGSDMLAVMPQMIMAGDLLRGSVGVVPLVLHAPARAAGLVVAAERVLSAAAEAFVSSLRDYLASVAAAASGLSTELIASDE